MKRYLVDANILFSALYRMESNAGALLMKAIEGQVQLYSTENVFDEMKRIIHDELGFEKEEVDHVISSLPVDWIERDVYMEDLEEALREIDDEGDASLLSCAHLTGMEVITGDRKLLGVHYKDVKLTKLKRAVG